MGYLLCSIRDLFRVRAKFEKVSFKQFYIDMRDSGVIEKLSLTKKDVKKMYDNIVFPSRKTHNSIGVDFTTPFDFELDPGESMVVPTGIKCRMSHGIGLFIGTRSGCGKFRIQLDDTMPAIDGDYYNCIRNEGHILVSLTNDNKQGISVIFNKDTSFIQGFFIKYYVPVNGLFSKKQKRVGGYGSTNQNVCNYKKK